MKVVDLTWRLPGPLATFLLARQGIEVVKYEDVNHRDPFLKWSWDPSFAEIYDAFQEPKQLHLIDFGSPDDVRALQTDIEDADIVVMSLPPRVEEKLGLTEEEIKDVFAGKGVCFLRLGFSRETSQSAHDLNTLIQSGLVRMHILDAEREIVAPPFLPVTGVLFSHHIAISALVLASRQAENSVPLQEWCWLQDAVDNIADAYYPPSIRNRSPATFLHNGRFPCYNIYRTADNGYVAMASVEPKFWSRFRELTGLNELSDDDGLADGARGSDVKRAILERISSKTASEWKDTFANEDVCVDVLDPIE